MSSMPSHTGLLSFQRLAELDWLHSYISSLDKMNHDRLSDMVAPWLLPSSG